MPSLNSALIGKTYGPIQVEILAHESIYYALATDDLNPAYTNGLREGGVMAPPMYAVRYAGDILPQIFFDKELGDGFYDVLVHGEQDMQWHQPVVPGQTVRTVATIVDIEDKGSGELLVVRSQSHCAKTEAPLCTQTLRFFVRGYGKLEKKSSSSSDNAPEDRSLRAFVAQQSVHLGQTFLYAEPSGDHNPIHIDDAFAKQVGLGGIILQGLCTMAFCHKAVVQKVCDGDPLRLKRLSVRFSKPVRPGDLLDITGWWLPQEGQGILGLEAANQRGDLVIKQGRATIL